MSDNWKGMYFKYRNIFLKTKFNYVKQDIAIKKKKKRENLTKHTIFFYFQKLSIPAKLIV